MNVNNIFSFADVFFIVFCFRVCYINSNFN